MAARLRREIEKHIPEDIEQTLTALSEIRDIFKSHKNFSGISSSDRGRILKLIVNSDALLQEATAASVSGRLYQFLLRLLKTPPTDA
jgi:siroheme synthase (precorrin-2 oxidase/ferrochelatase)